MKVYILLEIWAFPWAYECSTLQHLVSKIEFEPRCCFQICFFSFHPIGDNEGHIFSNELKPPCHWFLLLTGAFFVRKTGACWPPKKVETKFFSSPWGMSEKVILT